MDRITLGLLAMFGLFSLALWLGGRLAGEVSELAIAWLRAFDKIRAFRDGSRSTRPQRGGRPRGRDEESAP
ncbi:hypothetical protein [Streptomyces sp. NPDC057557]|uniref:hypothetical protein n=1 Tax=Streptomyces sp. NPDC057557 TaxID=3346167 RepID=UPI0036CB7211